MFLRLCWGYVIIYVSIGQKICSTLNFLFAKWVTICKQKLDNRTHVLVCDWYFQSYLGLRISLVNHLESVLVLRMKNLYKNAQPRLWAHKIPDKIRKSRRHKISWWLLSNHLYFCVLFNLVILRWRRRTAAAAASTASCRRLTWARTAARFRLLPVWNLLLSFYMLFLCCPPCAPAQRYSSRAHALLGALNSGRRRNDGGGGWDVIPTTFSIFYRFNFWYIFKFRLYWVIDSKFKRYAIWWNILIKIGKG